MRNRIGYARGFVRTSPTCGGHDRLVTVSGGSSYSRCEVTHVTVRRDVDEMVRVGSRDVSRVTRFQHDTVSSSIGGRSDNVWGPRMSEVTRIRIHK